MKKILAIFALCFLVILPLKLLFAEEQRQHFYSFLGIIFILRLSFYIYDHIKEKKERSPREEIIRYRSYGRKSIYVIPDLVLDREKAALDELDADFQTLNYEFQRQCNTLPELQTADELISKIKSKDLVSRFIGDVMRQLKSAPKKLGALYMLGRLIQESMTTDEDRVDAFKYYSRAYDQNEKYNQDIDLAQDIYLRSKGTEPVGALDLLDRKDGMFDDPVFYDLMYKEFKKVLPTEERTEMIGQLLCYSTYSKMSKKICSEANMSLLRKMASE